MTWKNLGFNLNGLGYMTEMPFLNIIRLGAAWRGNKNAGGGGLLGTLRSDVNGYSHFNVDSTGHLIDLTDPAGGFYDDMWITLFDSNVTNYAGLRSSPLGTYILLCDGGNGTVWSFAIANFVYKSGGYDGTSGKTRIVLDNPNWNAGQDRIHITTIGTTRPTNIRLVYEPNWTFTQAAGAAYDPTGSQPAYVGPREWSLMHDNEIWNPDFIAAVGPFKVFRFMDWLYTNGNSTTDISQRNPTDWIFWNDPTFGGGGASYEICVALCNKTGTHGWFNAPMLADNTYITDIANRIHDGSSGAPDAFGITWAGLNSNLFAFYEQGNEIWNDTIHTIANPPFTGSIWTVNAQRGASRFPDGLADQNSKFTGFIDDGSGSGSPAAGGHPGTVLTVTAKTSGTILHPGDANNIITDYPGHTITDLTRITAFVSGSDGGIGTYTVNTSQQTASVTIRQGYVNNIAKRQLLWQGVNGVWIWRSILGSQAKGIKGDQQTTTMAALTDTPSQFGGPSTWDGTHGGTVASNYSPDFVAPACYYDCNGMLPPAAWTDPATDPSYAKFKQEMLTGGILPLSTDFVTATDLSGNPLSAGWTQCKVTSGQSLADPPPNGTIVCVKFTVESGNSPTISIDGGSQQPMQNNYTGTHLWIFGAESHALGTQNLIWTDTIRTGAAPTAGWRQFNTGFTEAGHAGFLAVSTYHWMKLAYDNRQGLNLALYEGGPSFYGFAEPWLTYLAELHRSQAMGDCNARLVSDLQTFGFMADDSPFTYFADCNEYASNNGNFGAKEFIYDPNSASPKYMALLDFVEGGAGTGSGITTIHHGTGKHVGRPIKIPHV